MSIDLKFHVAYSDFSLRVDTTLPSTGVTALFGPSGCGKTTLLRAIAGLDRHHNGYLNLDGELWQSGTSFLPPHQRAVGYVFQEASLFPHLNVRRNIAFGIKRVPAAKRKIAIEEAIDLLDIAGLLERRIHELSGGERQRVAIARAIASSPRLLLMDEPLAALDTKRKREILPYIARLQQELAIPVIYVSHVHEEVSQLADHLLLLQNGQVAANGSIYEVLTRLDHSLAHDADAAALIDATVIAHDEQYFLTKLEFSGGVMSIAKIDKQAGEHVRVRLGARDISLTLNPQSATSILNIFRAHIDAISDDDGAQVTIRLLCGGVALLSRITRKSADELRLHKGKQVYAQVKSVALLG